MGSAKKKTPRRSLLRTNYCEARHYTGWKLSGRARRQASA